MGARAHKFRVAVWGEAPESPEERKVRLSRLIVQSFTNARNSSFVRLISLSWYAIFS